MLAKSFLLIIIFILTVLSAHAESGGGMVLFKEPPALWGRWISPLGGVGCNGLYRIDQNQEVPDLRDFRLFSCEGRYTLTLDGPSGTVATVFGAFNFKTERGFLIIRKADDRQVWLLNLEKFPPRQWHNVQPKDEYGGYAVYYVPGPVFEENIASVKWGQWWGEGVLEPFSADGK